MPSGGNAVFDVVFIGDENSHVASNIYEATLRGDQWEILPGIAGPEDIKAALAQFEQAERSREQNEREHRERLRQRAENYKKEFSFLERVKPGEPASASLGAVNLRNELASRFRDVHFLIRSQGFAAGDSIDIQWNFGPTAGEVEVIAGKYEQSFYDSRSKCHKLNDDDAWTPIFGGAKYIRYGRIT